MATITVRVSEIEKMFLNKMAKFEGKSLSDLLKTTTLESLEDEYDARVADYAYEEYLERPKSRPLSDVMSEYGLEDNE
ncbi:type II toxin-antitoxin system RelB family antitoxin [Listeria booriae]|uniref:Toxin-antitoxin system, antitoxin component n=1 Tax=Listeria booriae TaxID=1552123 RepID=A0A841ZXJ9_9LIST|nr:DUF6290 family protein [Listeria booriae]MBC1564742.1 toxin-antitoxin system, antitoxin component [Listeria booriae]